MSDAHGDERPHRPPPQPIAAPFLEVDLAREVEQLHYGLPASGQSAKTLVKYDDFRIVLIALTARPNSRTSSGGTNLCPDGSGAYPNAGARPDV